MTMDNWLSNEIFNQQSDKFVLLSDLEEGMDAVARATISAMSPEDYKMYTFFMNGRDFLRIAEETNPKLLQILSDNSYIDEEAGDVLVNRKFYNVLREMDINASTLAYLTKQIWDAVDDAKAFDKCPAHTYIIKAEARIAAPTPMATPMPPSTPIALPPSSQPF